MGQLRKDAIRNRAAILDAARELFAQSEDVSMCEVARHAGVGQATLYRNFPNRTALAGEILGENIERIAQLGAECAGDPDAFFVLLGSFVEGLVDLYTLGELARQGADSDSRIERNRRRVTEVMKRPLADAKRAGKLRHDTTIDDVLLVLLMVRGAMERAHGTPARALAASRALALVLEGLTTPGP